MAVKPVKPPALDGKAFVKPLRDAFPNASGQPRAVYGDGVFPAFLRWLRGEGEYDGKGLTDAVKTNADQLNQHLGADDVRHNALERVLADHESRLAAQESATGPFLSAFG